MTYEVVIRPEAIQDLIEARNWYESRRDNLGGEFLDAAEVALSRIEANPEMYAPGYREIRRAKLPRFPHIVYYRLVNSTIEVLAVLHGARHAGAWASRL